MGGGVRVSFPLFNPSTVCTVALPEGVVRAVDCVLYISHTIPRRDRKA